MCQHSEATIANSSFSTFGDERDNGRNRVPREGPPTRSTALVVVGRERAEREAMADNVETIEYGKVGGWWLFVVKMKSEGGDEKWEL
jgi:hypothetical protein